MSSCYVPGLAPVEYRNPSPYRDPVKPSRPFGLKTAPTLYPTDQEFSDPYAYIKSQRELGLKYGILKIVPPSCWNPRFGLDPRNFKFECRKQTLSGMGGITRSVVDFLDRLERIHSLFGKEFVANPTLAHNDGTPDSSLPVNFYWLEQAVRRSGGYDGVTQQEDGLGWARICTMLNYPVTDDIQRQLRALYVSMVLPYVKYAEGAQSFISQYQDADESESDSNSTQATDETVVEEVKMENSIGLEDEKTGLKKAQVNRPNRAVRVAVRSSQKRNNSETSISDPDSDSSASDTSVNSAANLRRSKRRRIAEDQPIRRSARLKSQETGAKADANKSIEKISERAESSCVVCQSAHTDLHCDLCGLDFHAKCLKQILYINRFATPWYCPFCIVGDGMFVFDRGNQYTLQEFQVRANSFRDEYITKHIPPCDHDTLEAALEELFWKHVNDANCDLTVEYGADIRCDLAGSGFPAYNSNDSYARDPWNLNNFAHNRMSLLRHLQKNISGVTVPWAYVGMLFSAFCWHSEDHYTYSLNYQHFGATKTWYGIPGSQAHAFERVSKSLVPELFEKQPHILYQRSTLLPPDLLMASEVPVYAVDQHAGEFVVTFPNAYHAGFNQGFNFNEAVNFAPVDWIPEGEQATADLKLRKKDPVFSFEELLLRVAQFETDPYIQHGVYPYVRQVVLKELENREQVTQRGVNDVAAQRGTTEDERCQCHECKCLCLLSRILHHDDKNVQTVYCYDHIPQDILAEDPSSLSLETIYTVDQLVDVLQQLLKRYEKTRIELGTATTNT